MQMLLVCATVAALIAPAKSVPAARATAAVAGVNSWTSSSIAQQISALLADPNTLQRLYASAPDGIRRSNDGGATWQPAVPGLANVTDLAFVDNTLYAINTVGVFSSLDGGDNWTLIRTGSGTLLAVDDSATNPILFVINGTTVNPFDIRSATWLTESTIGSSPLTVYDFAISDNRPISNYRYAGTSGGVYRFAAGSWTPVNNGITPSGTPPAIAVTDLEVDHFNPQTLYIIANNTLYITTDSGENWRQLPADAIPSGTLTSLTADKKMPERLYVGVNSTQGGGFYLSSDGGTTWQRLLGASTANELPEELIVDPIAGGTLYAPVIRASPPDTLIYAATNPPTHITVSMPETLDAGALFNLTATLKLLDDSRFAGFSGPVAVTLDPTTNPGAVRLDGTTTVNASDGTATFSGLSISGPASGLRLRVTVTGLEVTGQSAPLLVRSTLPATPLAETEPNNTLVQATPILLDTSGTALHTGTIAGANDADWFRLSGQAGATVTVRLSELAGDYDLALLSDPRMLLANTDATPPGVTSDTGTVGSAGQLIGAGYSEALPRLNSVGGQLDATRRIDLNGALIQLSNNAYAQDEVISVTLPATGDYYLLIYSATGDANSSRPYRLELQIQGGTASPTLTALPTRGAVSTGVRLFITNRARMEARYPGETAAITRLFDGLLKPGQAPGNLLSSAQVLDLNSLAVSAAARTRLQELYAQWDAAPTNVAYANQVALQIQAILKPMLAQQARTLILVGGDEIIPFYRQRDETVIGNQRDYAQQLRSDGAGDSALVAAFAEGFFFTDDFYADMLATPWRGRMLFMPDVAVGRLVERPTEIVRYLEAAIATDFTIDLSRTTAGQAGAALISGYSYTSDQAEAMRDRLAAFGLPDRARDTAQLGQALGANLLTGEEWTLADLNGLLFSSQLDQLTSGYNGPRSRYGLIALNGHFDHTAAEPAARDSGDLTALRLFNAPPAPGATPFFGATLLISAGCHAGLSAPDSAFTNPTLQADFAQTLQGQGASWIASSGYAYGDRSGVGYHERLALLLSEQLGRRIRSGSNYVGAEIGDSLMRAKRLYLRDAGPAGFSLFDEKALGQFTLYGLPFIRVKVPNPITADDQAGITIPDTLRENSGIITRVITLTNSFDSSNSARAPQLVSQIEDSFRPGATTTISGSTRFAVGRPLLPVISYDLTLKANPQTAGAPAPEARGVSLYSAKSLLPQPYDPIVTTLITETVYPAQASDQRLGQLNSWEPDIPYGIERTAFGMIQEQLVVTPAQFRARDLASGELRLFTKMVFVVRYLDPARASLVLLPKPKSPPSGKNTGSGPKPGSKGGDSYDVGVSVNDGDGDLSEVTATHTSDGENWQQTPLPRTGEDSEGDPIHSAEVPAPANPDHFSVIFEANDNAGNTTTISDKGRLGSIYQFYLPLVLLSGNLNQAGLVNAGWFPTVYHPNRS